VVEVVRCGYVCVSFGCVVVVVVLPAAGVAAPAMLVAAPRMLPATRAPTTRGRLRDRRFGRWDIVLLG
jgi:hypothetical protein